MSTNRERALEIVNSHFGYRHDADSALSAAIESALDAAEAKFDDLADDISVAECEELANDPRMRYVSVQISPETYKMLSERRRARALDARRANEQAPMVAQTAGTARAATALTTAGSNVCATTSPSNGNQMGIDTHHGLSNIPDSEPQATQWLNPTVVADAMRPAPQTGYVAGYVRKAMASDIDLVDDKLYDIPSSHAFQRVMDDLRNAEAEVERLLSRESTVSAIIAKASQASKERDQFRELLQAEQHGRALDVSSMGESLATAVRERDEARADLRKRDIEVQNGIDVCREIGRILETPVGGIITERARTIIAERDSLAARVKELEQLNTPHPEAVASLSPSIDGGDA